MKKLPKIKKTNIRISTNLLEIKYKNIPVSIVPFEFLLVRMINSKFKNDIFCSVDDDGFLFCDKKIDENDFRFNYRKPIEKYIEIDFYWHQLEKTENRYIAYLDNEINFWEPYPIRFNGDDGLTYVLNRLGPYMVNRIKSLKLIDTKE